MLRLKELSGTSSDLPPTKNMATLVFLFLLTRICKEKLKEFQGLHATILSTLPASAGLGSSAALSVCVAAGCLSLVGAISSAPSQAKQHLGQLEEHLSESVAMERRAHNVALPQSVLERLSSQGIKITNSDTADLSMGWSASELETINRWGLEAEKLIHGTPSGIDNSVSTFGGAIRFRSGQIHHLQSMPNVRILLVNTKVPRSTKKMVAGVRELLTKYPNVVGPVLESIEAISHRAELLLDSLSALSSSSAALSSTATESGTEAAIIHTSLQDLFVVNQHLLNALGVGHVALDRVCAMAQERGLAAKLTGAGGGGCAIMLIPPGFPEAKLKEAEEAFSTAGFDCWETTIGSSGVLAHNYFSTS
jgi:mevalonate kinase